SSKDVSLYFLLISLYFLRILTSIHWQSSTLLTLTLKVLTFANISLYHIECFSLLNISQGPMRVLFSLWHRSEQSGTHTDYSIQIGRKKLIPQMHRFCLSCGDIYIFALTQHFNSFYSKAYPVRLFNV
ncbi:hypothetical protein Tcan_00539, partial [Toxocara canis]